jgi:hypothetical protein
MTAYMKITIAFILGALFGFAVAIGIGWFLMIKGDAPLVSPKLYGDIAIAPLRPTQKDISGKELYQSLLLTQDDEKFIRINQDKLGNTRELYIFNDKGQAILSVEFAVNKEAVLNYGKSSLEYKCLYQRFIDFDMDGLFDYIINVDDNGEVNFESPYFKETQEWEEVSESNKDKDRIKINDTAYIFNPYEGWKEVDQAEL